MQKKIIALAVAALASGAALAQSNVQIYGVVDAGFAQYRGTGSETSNQIVSGGLSTSRLGFKGTEDLGNGLKALFVLEYRLDIDKNDTIGGQYTANNGVLVAGTAASAAGASGPARQQMVGLTGGFGTAVAGRLQTTGYDWMVKYQTLVATAFDVVNAVGSPTGARIHTARDARAENALAYISPNFNGFTVAVNHAKAVEQAPGVAAAAATSQTANLMSVDYSNGPMAAGLVYERLKGSDQDTTDRADWAMAGSYNFGVAKLNGTYQTTKNKAGVGVAGETNSYWHLGLSVPVTAKGAVVTSYAKNNMKTTAASDNAKGWNLAYTHELSKRTKAYAGYARVSNGDGNTASTAFLGAAPVTVTGSTSVLAAGVAHSF